jgi:hypothetical protein
MSITTTIKFIQDIMRKPAFLAMNRCESAQTASILAPW